MKQLYDKNTLIAYLMNELSDNLIIEVDTELENHCWVGKIHITERPAELLGGTLLTNYTDDTLKALEQSIDDYYKSIYEGIMLSKGNREDFVEVTT